MSQKTGNQFWGSSSANFVDSWNLENPGGFEITTGSQSGVLDVEVTNARGLKNDTYEGVYIGGETHLEITFVIKADGLSGNQKRLSYEQPIDGVSAQTALSPASGRNTAGWGGDLEDFEGTWDFSNGGELIIMNGAQIQATGVDGLKNAVYQGAFDSSAKEIKITFILADNGHVGGNSANPKEILFSYPEIILGGGQTTPSEGELFEAEGGGG